MVHEAAYCRKVEQLGLQQIRGGFFATSIQSELVLWFSGVSSHLNLSVCLSVCLSEFNAGDCPPLVCCGVLKEGSGLMKTEIVTIERITARCQDLTLSTGQRLLSCLSLLSHLLAAYCQIRDRAAAAESDAGKIRSSLSGSLTSENCDTRYSKNYTRRRSAWGNRGWLDSPDRQTVSKLCSLPSGSSVDDLSRYRQTVADIRSDAEVLDQYFQTFEQIRKAALTLKTYNRCQMICQQILTVSLPDPKWRNCKSTKETIGCINGNFLETARRFPGSFIPVRKYFGEYFAGQRLLFRRLIDRRGKKQGRLCVADGQSTVERIRPSDDVRQTLTDRLRMSVEISVSRYLSDLYQTLPFVVESRQADVKTAENKLAELSADADADADAVRFWQGDLSESEFRLRKSTDAAVRLESGKYTRQTAEFCRDWRLFHSVQMKSAYTAIPEYMVRDDANYRVPVSQILTVRRCLSVSREDLAALKRHRTVSSVCPSAVSQIVVGRTTSTGSVWQFTLPDSDSVCTLQILQTPVVMIRSSTACSGIELTVERTGNQVIDDLMSKIDSYHIEAVSDITEQNIQSARNAFGHRLLDARQRLEYDRKAAADAAAAKQRQRQEIAAAALKLRKVSVVRLTDSYAVGNCKPGTAAFCSAWGITADSISGQQLVRIWRARGWEYNYNFLRIVQRLTVDCGVTE